MSKSRYSKYSEEDRRKIRKEIEELYDSYNGRPGYLDLMAKSLASSGWRTPSGDEIGKDFVGNQLTLMRLRRKSPSTKAGSIQIVYPPIPKGVRTRAKAPQPSSGTSIYRDALASMNKLISLISEGK